MPILKRVFTASLLSLLLFPSASAKEDVRNDRNRVIYECFVRNFSPEGTLDGVTAQMDRLNDLGIDVLWLMPIFEIGTEGRWGSYGSPYAAKDYRKISPDLGTDQDFHELIAKAHELGIEVWMDFAANHTAMEHEWVRTHPEYYRLENGRPIHINGWNDVYPLNFENAELRKALIADLKYWVDNFGIDGFRCDYAEGPSRQFWQEATEAMPNITWMAESGGESGYHSLMDFFDYNYAWWHSDEMVKSANFRSPSALANISNTLHTSNYGSYAGSDKSRMVYISNHDIVQDNGKGTEDKVFGDNLKQMIVYYFTIYGMPLIYNGQEVQYSSGNITISEKTPIEWNHDSEKAREYTALYKKLTELKHTEKALWTGSEQGVLVNHTTNNENVYAYERRHPEGSVVVILNTTNRNCRNVSFTSALPTGMYRDIFTGERVDLGNKPTFNLAGRENRVFVLDEDQSGAVSGPSVPDIEDMNEITNSVYVANRTTDWGNDLYIYCYSPEAFGQWPGKLADATVEIDGTTFQRFDFPKGNYGTTFTLIFHNNGADDTVARRVENGTTVSVTGQDVYFTLIDTDATAFEAPVVEPEEPSEPVEPEVTYPYSIYVHDLTGWGDFAIYAYANNSPAMFNGWPGATATETVEIEGVSYKRFPMPSTFTDVTQTIIFNNNNGVQLNSEATVTPNRDYYFTVTAEDFTEGKYVEEITPDPEPEPDPEPTPEPNPEGHEYAIYIEDLTGWNNVALYGYNGTGNNPAELYGAWPGTQDYTTVTFGDITYKRFAIPADKVGQTYSLSLNNTRRKTNSTMQKIDEAYEPRVTLDRDYFFTFNSSVRVYSVYVMNRTTWGDELRLYAWWGEGENQFFGGWRELAPQKFVLNDHEYLRFSINPAMNGQTAHIIPSGTDAQYDLTTADFNNDLTADRDHFITLGDDITWYRNNGELYTRQIDYFIYITDYTDTYGDNLYVYAYNHYNGLENAAVYEPFGAYPGMNAQVMTVENAPRHAPAADGGRKLSIRVPKWTHDLSYNLIINDGTDAAKLEFDPMSFATDNYITIGQPGPDTSVGIESVTHTGTETAVYYNLQGVRVENPEQGIFICVEGSRTAKVVIR